MNLSDLIAARARGNGDKTWLLFERQPDAARDLPGFRRDLSYAEFDRRVNRACHFLSACGIGRGDVVNLHLPNCPAFLLLWFAIARRGAVLHAGKFASERDLVTFCAECLASFRVPERVVFEDALPKTSVGKIQKHVLRAALQQ